MRLPEALDGTFEALVFDWDGTAVPDRRADAAALRRRVEALCRAGVHLFVVSGTHVGNVDGQLGARPAGRGRLHLCCNRGSEVYEVTREGPSLSARRTASADEERALDRAAGATAAELASGGLEARVVAGRLNRRKIDLIPLPGWEDPPKAAITDLVAAVTARLAGTAAGTLVGVVDVARRAATAAGLADPRVTSDGKHVEIGLTDKSDSARFATAWLADRGVTGQLVLVAGDELGPLGGVPGSDSLMMVAGLARAPVVSVGVEPGGVPGGVAHLGGGPRRFLALLDDQLERRAARRVPRVDADPRWVLPLPRRRGRDRVAESLGSLANGWAGTRGAREEGGAGSTPLFAVAGAYDDAGQLLHGPLWTGLDRAPPPDRDDDRRLVDLRTGTLARQAGDGSGYRSVRFVSVVSPHAMALRAEGPAARMRAGAAVRDPGGVVFRRLGGEGPSVTLASVDGRSVAVAASERETRRGTRRMVERLAGWSAGSSGSPVGERAARALAEAAAVGFDGLLADHREAWVRRWADAEVAIEGGPGAAGDELAARFAVFHLLAAAADAGEAAVGARGVTGEADGGHVCWDADVFVLPALAALQPPAARAMLEYRARRLPAARDEARARGLEGARFPWESAGDGRDVTPGVVRGRDGEEVPVMTGRLEEHIVADVAWSADRYAAWTGDGAYVATGPGLALLVETARYWAGRIRVDAEGRGHLDQVMGPDEYHQVVDDNAFTNGMARWNLRRGAELLARSDRSGDRAEAARWRALASRLVDGWDPERGIYEQFRGYFWLEPLVMAEVARPPVAADLLLGPARVAGSQLVKQVDVLMLHHLVPDDVVPGSLEPCLDYYEPRTAHGSSLSPAVSAALLARADRPEAALALYRLAARLDLDDLTGTTAGGLHLGTMGGVWLALAQGFLGLAARGDVLVVDPHLPGEWSALSLRLRYRGRRVGVRATHHEVGVTCDGPLRVAIGGRAARICEPPGATFRTDRPAGRARRQR